MHEDEREVDEGAELMELAKDKLLAVLERARELGVRDRDVLCTKSAKKLLSRTGGLFGKCSIRMGMAVVFLLAAFYLYARWPTSSQDVDTVRTVLRKTVSLFLNN